MEDAIAPVPVSPGQGRRAKVIRFVAVIVASLVLATTLVFVGGRIAAHSTASTKETVYDSCVAGNTFRTNDLKTWQKLNDVLGPFDSQTEAKLVPFFAFVKAKDKLRKCNK